MRVRYSFSSRRTGRIEGRNDHSIEFDDIIDSVIRKSDIVLEVIDSRFIHETRNKKITELCQNQNKPLFYIINKSDVSDKERIQEKTREEGLDEFLLISCKTKEGIKKLRDKIIISYKKIKKKNKKIKIGVVGYPNSGKSSLINLLARKGSCKISSMSGYTKGEKFIRFNKDIMLIDTPGLIPKFEKDYDRNVLDKKKSLKVISSKDYNKVKNPEILVDSMMKMNGLIMEKFYDISSDNDSEIFLEKLAVKKKFLKKGGLPDVDRASRLVIRDFQEGRLRFK